MWIQVLLIIAIIAVGGFFMRRTGADSHLAIRRIIFGIFVVIALLAVIFPQWLTWFAQLIGVGRGTDLLLYMLCMIFLAFVYTQFRRNAEMQQKVTRLARAIALMEAEQHRSLAEAEAQRTADEPSEDA